MYLHIIIHLFNTLYTYIDAWIPMNTIRVSVYLVISMNCTRSRTVTHTPLTPGYCLETMAYSYAPIVFDNPPPRPARPTLNTVNSAGR